MGSEARRRAGWVAFGGDRELGEVGVADDTCRLTATLDVAAAAADDLDRRLARVRASKRELEPAADREAGERRGLLQTLARRRGGSGMGAIELVGELAQAVERELVVV